MMTMPAEDRGPRSFTSAVSLCLKRYFQLSGRAPRSEYWYFFLFTVLVSIATSIAETMLGPKGSMFGLIDLAFIIPSITVLVRRLHDIDRTGWWAWIILIPLVGWIVLLIWACISGTPGPNRFGPDPLAWDGEAHLRVQATG